MIQIGQFQDFQTLYLWLRCDNMRNFVLTPKGTTNLWNLWFQEYFKPFNLDINSLIDTISNKGRVYNITADKPYKTFNGKNYYCPALLDYKNFFITEGNSYIFTGTIKDFIALKEEPTENYESIASGRALFRRTQPANTSIPYDYSSDDYYQFQYGVAATYQIQTQGFNLVFKYTTNCQNNSFYILPCSLPYREKHSNDSCIFNHQLNLFAQLRNGDTEEDITYMETNIQPHYDTVYIDYQTYESIFIEDTLISNTSYYYSISSIDTSLPSSATTLIKDGHVLTI